MAARLSSSILKSLSSAAKTGAFIALCAATGIIIVFPLWRFATSFPRVYTAVTLACIALLVAFRVFSAAKKSSRKAVLRVLIHALIIAGGIWLAASLVFAGLRFAAIPVVVLIPILYIVCSRFFETA